MKILMFGRGVISTLYGWALEKAGHQVEIYVRPGRAAEYGHSVNLDILDARKNPFGIDVKEVWPIHLREEIATNNEGDYDLIVCSVPHYSFVEAAKFLAPRLGQATLLIFNNFWQDPLMEAAAADLPAEQLVWGFPMAGGAFDGRGDLDGALMASVQLGTFLDHTTGKPSAPSERHRAVSEMFRQSGFSVIEQSDFRGWLWIHFALVAGLEAQILKLGQPQKLAASVKQLREMILNVREILPLVAARGVDLSKHANDTMVAALPSWLAATTLYTAISIMPPAARVMNNIHNRRELQETCRDVLEEGRRRNFKMPRMAANEIYFAGPEKPDRKS